VGVGFGGRGVAGGGVGGGGGWLGGGSVVGWEKDVGGGGCTASSWATLKHKPEEDGGPAEIVSFRLPAVPLRLDRGGKTLVRGVSNSSQSVSLRRFLNRSKLRNLLGDCRKEAKRSP